uniref:Chemokine interleukin-8-like domain-containing protein n=1 Tax=Sinocyclocheilus rhinocerous TaxID=307959 RepID=A0A673KR34_9TELE
MTICITLCLLLLVYDIKYSSQPFPVLRLKDFTWQDATMTCNIEAVIFTSVKNRQICANPDDLWVQNAILHIQGKKGRST